MTTLATGPKPADSMVLPAMGFVGPELRPARGDIWRVDFGAHPADPEQAFHRPALIVSDDQLHHPRLRIVIVVPGTTTIRRLPLHVLAEPGEDNGLERPTAFQVEQVRAISTERLIARLGHLNAETVGTVDETLRHVLRLP